MMDRRMLLIETMATAVALTDELGSSNRFHNLDLIEFSPDGQVGETSSSLLGVH